MARDIKDAAAVSDRQIVVLGASAGGIEALTAVLERLPSSFEPPILVAQHLDPHRPSHLVTILQRNSQLPVRAVEEGSVALEPGTVYVLRPDRQSRLTDTELRTELDGADRPSPSIDHLLTEAAHAFGEGVIAVILTGGGSDGAAGARDVKAGGGTVVIQNPETADHPSMPSAISPPIVDIVADLDAIGPLLVDLVASPRPPRRGEEERLLQTFLNQVRERSGIDFASYKPGTIMRRLQRRMVATNQSRLREYIRYLADHPDEYQRLTSSFLIKVTEFFRDADLFETLRDEILPKLIAEARERDYELRLWSAGCATGEEAYSLGMLVADALGDELGQFNVRIFATDVDLDAISFARRGIYPANALTGVPERVRERHFTRVGDQYEIRKQIRAMTVFGQHDLGHRAPFPRVDLALCRNVLIYFTSELQKRALQLFAFALRDGGYLVLGKAESTSPLPEYFVLEKPRQKIYRRQGERVLIPPARIRDTTPLLPARMAVTRRGAAWTVVGDRYDQARSAPVAERADQLLQRLPIGILVVDRRYDIQSLNAESRRLLGIHGQAIGDDLIHTLTGDLAPKVKSAVDAAFEGAPPAPFVVDIVQSVGTGSETRSVQLGAHPAGPESGSRIDSVIVLAIDVSASASIRRDLETAIRRETGERGRLSEQVSSLAEKNAELMRANQELTGANAELRSANEELLVANEEVQAATEEVETLNEELQATNEELETLNEELQATVEELNATNDDLEARSLELQESALAAETQRSEAEIERSRLLSVLDVLPSAILLVADSGEVVVANRAFRRSVGDPEELALTDGDGQELTGRRDPRRRAIERKFEEQVTAGTRRFDVSGSPLDGEGGRYGVLIFTEPAS